MELKTIKSNCSYIQSKTNIAKVKTEQEIVCDRKRSVVSLYILFSFFYIIIYQRITQFIYLNVMGYKSEVSFEYHDDVKYHSTCVLLYVYFCWVCESPSFYNKKHQRSYYFKSALSKTVVSPSGLCNKIIPLANVGGGIFPYLHIAYIPTYTQFVA